MLADSHRDQRHDDGKGDKNCQFHKNLLFGKTPKIIAKNWMFYERYVLETAKRAGISKTLLPAHYGVNLLIFNSICRLFTRKEEQEQ
ncbi:hypothetical protein [Pantoea coffeiphila]|uniref:Uncharacterized protein n=1 Tax=Pantoea coffeiphila TaxID=1465635 RepID=A0A2S9IH71_9GAMM|nr:hypothetical protein [Pantoea coffeiphila]PRD17133.1 hypothetical protein CQW29_00410 [Pantoea coffeiphila]